MGFGRGLRCVACLAASSRRKALGCLAENSLFSSCGFRHANRFCATRDPRFSSCLHTSPIHDGSPSVVITRLNCWHSLILKFQAEIPWIRQSTRSALSIQVLTRVAYSKLAPVRSDSVKSTSVRSALAKQAPLRFASTIRAPVMTELSRSAPSKVHLDRSDCVKSARISSADRPPEAMRLKGWPLLSSTPQHLSGGRRRGIYLGSNIGRHKSYRVSPVNARGESGVL